MVKTKEMNKDMDTRTPRDRITDDFLRRIEAEESSRHEEDEVKHHRPVSATLPEYLRYERDESEKRPRRHLAMVYSPEQMFGDLYDTDEAFVHGTIFRDLDFPFYPTKCKENGGTCR